MRLRVMTLNILEPTARTRLGGWPIRRPRAAAVLDEWQPDILGLQEATLQQLDDIAADVAAYEVVAGPPSGTRRSPDSGRGDGERCAILFRRSRFHLADQRAFWLSERPARAGSRFRGTLHPRVANQAALTEVPTGRRVVVCCTHVDIAPWAWACSGATLSDQLGSGSADRLDLLVGDFNAPARSRLYRCVKAAGWHDAWLAARETAGPAATYHAGRGRPAWPGRIDRIFLRPALTVERAATVTPADGAAPPSDHYPVTADILWP